MEVFCCRAAERTKSKSRAYTSANTPAYGQLQFFAETRLKAGKALPVQNFHGVDVLTYMLSGRLNCQSTAGKSQLLPGDLYTVNATEGLQLECQNPSQVDSAHFVQLALTSTALNSPQRRNVAKADKRAKLCVLYSAEILLYSCMIDKKEHVYFKARAGRKYWLQQLSGSAKCNDLALETGDGIGFTSEQELHFTGLAGQSEFLFFDLPA